MCGRMLKMKSLKKSTMAENRVVEKETVKTQGGIYTLSVFIPTHSQMMPREIITSLALAASMKMLHLFGGVFFVLRLIGLSEVHGAGECSKANPDMEAFKLAPCASAAQDENASVSSLSKDYLTSLSQTSPNIHPSVSKSGRSYISEDEQCKYLASRAGHVRRIKVSESIEMVVVEWKIRDYDDPVDEKDTYNTYKKLPQKVMLEEIVEVGSSAVVMKPFKKPGLKINRMPQLLLEGPKKDEVLEEDTNEANTYGFEETANEEKSVSDSEESDNSQDSDFLVDEENLINEVDVDMQEFYHDIDKDVEWVGHNDGNLEGLIQMDVEEGYDLDEFDMDIDRDSDIETSSRRKKALRTLRREHEKKSSQSRNKGSYFFIGKEFVDKKDVTTSVTSQIVATRTQLYIWKNDKIRVRVVCRGKCSIFNETVGRNASGLSSPSKSPLKQVNGKLVKENDTWTVKTFDDEHAFKAPKEQLKKKYQVGITIGKVKRARAICRKWELIGMPCKHAVAVKNDMALSRQDSKHPNPYIIIPPKIHTHIGRPPKARKKSADELSSQRMSANGKLSRAGKTVTCLQCHNQGHNRRSCKENVGGS
ncbi:transposase, MuDR [Tanacetum coccineum]